MSKEKKMKFKKLMNRFRMIKENVTHSKSVYNFIKLISSNVKG